MENWANAQREINRTLDLNADLGDLPLQILSSNKTTPMIRYNVDGSYNYNNIDEEK